MPYLLRRIHQARTKIETQISFKVNPERMATFYGRTPFRCPVVQCPYFVAGFEKFEAREGHYNAHKRSFMCTYESCDYSVLGLPSKAALKSHLHLCHEAISAGSRFPSIKSHSVGKSLEDAIKANDILAVTALATELAAIQEEKRPKGFVVSALSLKLRELALILLDIIGTPSEIDYVKNTRAAILEASENGDDEMVTVLLDKGGDPNMGYPMTDTNPICKAIKNGNSSIVHLLLFHPRFEISRTTKFAAQEGPIIVASTCGKLDILSQILDVELEYYKLIPYSHSKGNTHVAHLKGAINSAVKQKEEESAKLLVRLVLENNRLSVLAPKVLKIAGHNVDKIVDVLFGKGPEIQQGPEVKPKGGTRDNILQTRAHEGDVTNVTRLLDLGADIDKDAGRYGTPLLAAVLNNKLDVVTLLLNRGADIEKASIRHKVPLIAAVSNNNPDVVNLLLDRGADIHKTDGIETPIIVAVLKNKPDIVNLLLDRGAYIDEYAGRHGTPLMAAVSNNQSDLVSLLLDRGANIMVSQARLPENHSTAPPAVLDLAAVQSYETIVLALLARGASFLHDSTHHHMTCYCYSLQIVSRIGTSPLIARILLEHGAGVDARPPFPKYYAFETPTQLAAGEGNDSVLQVLLEWDPDVNFKGVSGDLVSPLYLAAQGGHTNCVRQLLSSKFIDVNAHQESAQGDTALIVAIKKDRPGIVDLLVEHGADINAVNDQNENGLLIAMRDLPFDKILLMVKKLINYRIRMNVVNDAGNNAFMVGALRPNLPPIALEALRSLFSNGMNIHLRNNMGKSALVLATEINNYLVLECLLQCITEGRLNGFQ
jgi:ankyrin repeat protein